MNEKQRLESQQVKTANPSDKKSERITANIFKRYTSTYLKEAKTGGKKK